MRVVVLVLLLANLLFYVYSSGYMAPERKPGQNQTGPEVNAKLVRIVGHGENPPTQEELLELDRIEAEKLAKLEAERQEQAARVEAENRAEADAVKNKAKEADKEKASESAPVNIKEACFRWNNLSSKESETLATTLIEKIPMARVERIVVPDQSSGWWVMVPPSKTRDAAVIIAEQLKAIGITDLFIINEGSKKFAISLGVFTTEKSAKEHLSRLVAKGAEMARAEPRSIKEATYIVEVVAPTDDNILSVSESIIKDAPDLCGPR